MKPLTASVLFFALARERIFIETHSIESRCYRIGKYTVRRRVRASFSPDWSSEVVNQSLFAFMKIRTLKIIV